MGQASKTSIVCESYGQALKTWIFNFRKKSKLQKFWRPDPNYSADPNYSQFGKIMQVLQV